MINRATSTPEEIKFHQTLETLAQPKFGQSLLVDASGEIKETHFLRAIFEKLKGFFGGYDRTNKSLVELKIIHFLARGISNNWLKANDLKLVKQLALRVGLTAFDSQTPDKHHELRLLVGLIDATVQKKMEFSLKDIGLCDKLIEKYAVAHQKALSPFQLQITKFAPAPTDPAVIVLPPQLPGPVVVAIPHTEGEAYEEKRDTASQSQTEQEAQPEAGLNSQADTARDNTAETGVTTTEEEAPPQAEEQNAEYAQPFAPAAPPKEPAVTIEVKTALRERQITQINPVKLTKPAPLKQRLSAVPREGFCYKVTKFVTGALAIFGGAFAGVNAQPIASHTYAVVPAKAAAGVMQTTANFANVFFGSTLIDSHLQLYKEAQSQEIPSYASLETIHMAQAELATLSRQWHELEVELVHFKNYFVEGGLKNHPQTGVGISAWIKEQAAALKRLGQTIEDLQYNTPQPNEPMDIFQAWQDEIEVRKTAFAKTKAEIEAMHTSLKGFLKTPLQALLDAPTIPIDERTLLHAIGDVFGKHSLLEGSTRGEMLGYLQQVVKSKIDALRQSGLCDDEARQAFCRDLFGSGLVISKAQRQSNLMLFEDLAKKLDKAVEIDRVFQQKSAAPLHNKLKTEIDALVPGKSFFFSGGWEGHAIVHEIIKQSNGQLTFRVYNTGEGLAYYQRAVIETDTLFATFIEIVDIPTEKLLDYGILNALQELQKTSGKGLGPRDFYARILPFIGGKISQADHKADELRAAQQSGTCGYMSLMAAFSQQLGDQTLPRQFDFEVQLKALCDYDALHGAKYGDNQQGLNLMDKGTAAFAVALDKWHSQGVVSDADRELALQKIQGIRQRLQTAQAELAIKAVEVQPKLEIQSILADGVFPLSTIKYNVVNNLREVSYKAKALESNDEVFTTGIKDWQPVGASFAVDAKKFLDNFQNIRKPGHLIATQEAIVDFARKIPLHDAAFWLQLDGRQAAPLLETLAAFSREFVFNQAEIGGLDANRAMQVKPCDYLAMVKIVTVSDKIARQSAKELGFELPSLYQQNFGHFLESESLYFTLLDPAAVMESVAIKEYWSQRNPKGAIPDFFGLEKYPAGIIIKVWTFPITLKDYNRLPADKKHPVVNWLVDWIKQEHMQAKINESYPELLKEDPLKRALKILEKNERKKVILPDSFFVLLETSFFTDYLLTGYLSEFNLRNNIKSELRSFFSVDFGRDDIYVSLGSSYLKIDPRDNRDGPEKDYDIGYGSVWPEAHLGFTAPEIHDKTLLEISIRDKALSGEFKRKRTYWSGRKVELPLGERRRVVANEIGISTPERLELSDEASQKLNLQQMRRLLGLSSDAKLQVQATLGYFKQNPHLLAKQNYRDLFNMLLFDGGLLWEEMQTPEQTVSLLDQLAIYCQEGLKTSLQPAAPDDEAAIFFIQLNRRLVGYIEGVQKQAPERFPEGFKAVFFDTVREIKTLLQESHPRMIQHALYRELVAYYAAQQTLTADDIVDFLISDIQLSLYGPHERQPDTLADIHETRDALLRKREELYRMIAQPEGGAMLDRVVHAFYPDVAKQTWDTSHMPLCVTTDGEYTVDVAKGSVYAKSIKLSSLPAAITTHKTYREHFNDQIPSTVLQIDKDSFEFRDNSGRLCRMRHISAKDKNEVIVQRQFGAQWFQEVPLSVLQFKPSCIYQNAKAWGSVFAEGKNPEVVITHKETHALLYRIERTPADKLVIHHLDENGNKTGLVVSNLAASQGAQSFLKRFEDFSHIVILQDAITGLPSRIELPRYAFAFSVKQVPGKTEWRAYTADGYALAETQYIASLAKLDNYLVLEKTSSDGKRQQRVMLSDSVFETIRQSSLTPDAIRKPEPDSRAKSLLVCDVNPVSGELEPGSDAARLMLARNYLWVQDYARAQKYLHGLGSLLQPLSEQEKAILFEITKLNEGNKDPHPKAIALRLKALALLLRHLEDIGTPASIGSDANDPLQKQIYAMLYTDYPDYLEDLEYLGDLGDAKLSVGEEVLLLKRLDSKKNAAQPSHIQTVLTNRLNRLAAESYGILQQNPPNSNIWQPVIALYNWYIGNDKFQKPAALDCDEVTWIDGLRGYKEVVGGIGRRESKAAVDKDSILQANLYKDFPHYYSILSKPSSLSRENLLTILAKLSGTDYSQADLSIEALWQSLRTTFNIKLSSQIKDESMSALILLQLIDHASDFPGEVEVVQTLKLFINDLHNSYSNFDLKHKAVISKLLAISKGYYKATVSSLPLDSMMEVKPAAAHTPQEIEGQCLKFVNHLFGFKPVFKIADFFIKVPSEIAPAESFKDKPALTEALSVHAKDKAVQRQVDEIKASIDGRKAPAGKAPVTYAVKDYAKLHSLKLNLMRTLELGHTRLVKQRRQIEAGVNRPYADRRLQAAREVRLASGVERPVGIDEALRLFLHADTAFYRQRNPALSDNDVAVLVKNIQTYLEDATYHQHLARVAAAIEQLEKLKTALAPEEDIRQAVQEVASVAAAYRSYDVAKHPQYLVFEYYMHVLMRQDQVENLDKLGLKEGKIGAPQQIGAVLEMIMGAGKTSVLLPLLSLLNADGSKLAIGILPDTLMSSMAPELQKTLGQSFKQVLEVLECRRETKLEAAQLQRLLERFQRSIDERRVVLMSKSSLHSLYLKFVEKLHSYTANAASGSKQEALLAEIKLFQKLFGVLKASGNALVDEVDSLMNPLQSSHYTIGSATPLADVYGEVAADLSACWPAMPSSIKASVWHFLNLQVPFHLPKTIMKKSSNRCWPRLCWKARLAQEIKPCKPF